MAIFICDYMLYLYQDKKRKYQTTKSKSLNLNLSHALTKRKGSDKMIPDDSTVNESVIIINGIEFEDLNAYFDYITD